MRLNRIILALILFVHVNLFAQTGNIKGDGLISVNPENYPTIQFYKNKEDTKPIKSIKIFDDKEINSFNIKDLDLIEKEWFKPLHINLDYYIFYFQCSNVDANWYQIIVDEESNLKYWIKKSPDLKYLSWEKFICETVTVRPIDTISNPILISPNLNSEKCKKQLVDCLMPIETKGDWLKVKVEPAICDKTFEMKDDEIFEGYIRWRKDDKLLIEYFLTL
ncbi:hypothetical protein [Mangrovibacterium diazotrophicum]|uniref:hypothetical protein n=1 Tax=Mangrovibacterium diazotrophicum TaxID=1261403 RepID=UPI000E735B86|nr:hypothetical protein [Mangrovibacterium diazotrophicum]